MKKGTLFRLASYVGKYKMYMFISLIFALISNVLIAFMPLIVGKGIDNIKSQGKVDFNNLLKIIIVLAAVYLISSIFTWLFTAVANILAYNTVRDLRNEALSKISTLPLKYFDVNPHGDIMSRLTNDMDAISDGLFQGITQFFPAIVTIISSILLMLSLSIKLTGIIILMTPLCFFYSIIYYKTI
ncbi:ABC-type multidrug transport system fused ATPase/permease subunit [Clostridium acetobutylicum]|nr:ABC-type multidrug transport system fused ATPase/permease subunit [Clostridium acetobutylicum]